MLQHPFISSVQDNQPLRALYGEVRADVVEVVEEVPSNQVIPLSQDVSFTVSGCIVTVCVCVCGWVCVCVCGVLCV